MAVADGDQVVARPGAHRSVAEEIDDLVVAWPARHHVAAAVAVDVVVAVAAENPVVTPGALQQNVVPAAAVHAVVTAAGEQMVVAQPSPGLAPSASFSRVHTFMFTTTPMISRIFSASKCFASPSWKRWKAWPASVSEARVSASV
jgi:citrate lyase synthetase